eukprot:Awhi_evm1s1435
MVLLLTANFLQRPSRSRSTDQRISKQSNNFFKNFTFPDCIHQHQYNNGQYTKDNDHDHDYINMNLKLKNSYTSTCTDSMQSIPTKSSKSALHHIIDSRSAAVRLSDYHKHDQEKDQIKSSLYQRDNSYNLSQHVNEVAIADTSIIQEKPKMLTHMTTRAYGLGSGTLTSSTDNSSTSSGPDTQLGTIKELMHVDLEPKMSYTSIPVLYKSDNDYDAFKNNQHDKVADSDVNAYDAQENPMMLTHVIARSFVLRMSSAANNYTSSTTMSPEPEFQLETIREHERR